MSRIWTKHLYQIIAAVLASNSSIKIRAAYYAVPNNGGPVIAVQLTSPAPYTYRSSFKKTDGFYDWETELEWGWSMIDRQTVGSLAAFIMEPILSTGSVLVPPKGYLKRMAVECKKRNMLLIMDEAQTGLGHTGRMFAFQHEGIVPDILALSKTLGCGLPLASVSTTAEIERGSAVGKKVLEIIERDNIIERAGKLGIQLQQGLEKLQKKYWCIGDVRGQGLFQGIEIISDTVTRAPGFELSQAVSDRALALGLSCNLVTLPGMGGVFRFGPPATASVEEIEEGLRILDEAFGDVLGSREVIPAAV